MTPLEQAARELAESARLMRDAINALWLAHNSELADEFPGPLLTIEDAQEQQSSAFIRLQRAEYYMEKELMRVAAYNATEGQVRIQQRIAELTAERDRLREAIEDGPCSCRIVDIEGRMCNAPFLSLHSPNCWKREALEGGKS